MITLFLDGSRLDDTSLNSSDHHIEGQEVALISEHLLSKVPKNMTKHGLHQWISE